MNISPRLAIAVLASVLLQNPRVQAIEIWAEDFAGEPNGALPTQDYTVDTVNDWVVTGDNNGTQKVRINTGVGAAPGAPALTITDTGTSSPEPQATVAMSQFADFNTTTPGQEVLRFGFDMRVDSYVISSNFASTPRFILDIDSSTGAKPLVFGFGRGDVTSATSGDELFFFANYGQTTAAFAPLPATAGVKVGYSGGAAGTFAEGFNFGTYSTTTADNDTGDEFYRFAVDYDTISGGISGTVTRVSVPEEQVSFSLSATPNLVLSNVTDASNTLADRFFIRSGQSAQSVSSYDNIHFQAVPEPGTCVGLLGGLGMLAGWQRLRRRG